MLIYNHKKEFVGIDETDLNALGFSSLEALKLQAEDFADMFVKKPGYVHNFQHVNWIDFISCADSTENRKVIIHANDTNFTCLLDIQTVYLSNEPNSKAFLVYLHKMREFHEDGSQSMHKSSASLGIRPEAEIFEKETPVPDELSIIEDIKASVPPTLHVQEETPLELPIHEQTESLEEALSIELDDVQEIIDTPAELPIKQEVQKQKKQLSQKQSKLQEVYSNGYTYNPQLASDELGLPVELIEEFIEDFIAQAKEFKEAIYKALEDGDKDKLKILSHKLKGVAANLRIEDALESLTIVNTSEDAKEIHQHLKIFYSIIAKLAGETILVSKDIPALTIDTSDAMDAPATPREAIEEVKEEKADIALDIFALPQEEIQEDIQEEKPSLVQDELETENIFTEAKEQTPKVQENKETQTKSTQEPIANVEVALSDKEAFTVTEESQEEDIHIEYTPSLVASEIGLSQDNFMELLEDYVVEAEGLLQIIALAISENKNLVWKSKTMQLKGMSDNMRLTDFTKELETLMQTQKVKEAQDAYERIQKYVQSISKIKE